MKKLSAIVILFIYSLNGYGQDNASDSTKLDSLKKVLLTEKEDSNKVNTLLEVSRRLFLIGGNNGNLEYANQALDLSKKIHDKKLEAKAYLRVGGNNQENLTELLKNSYAALKIYDETGDKKGVATCQQGIAVAYFNQGNDSASLTNIAVALKTFQETGDSISVAQCYLIIGSVYSRQNKYSKALEKFFVALKIFQEPTIPGWGTAVTYLSIGETYQDQGDSFAIAGNTQNAKSLYLKALSNYRTSLKNYQKIRMEASVAGLYRNLGDIYIRLKRIPEASQSLQMGLRLSLGLQDKQLFSDTYETLSDLDSIKANYKKAYENYKLHIVYRDSLNNEKNSKKFVQTEMQYNFDKKDAIAKAAQAEKDADAKRIKNQQYFAIAGLGLVVLAVIIIALIQFRNNKHKQKANLLLERQKQKVETTLQELKSTQAQLIQSEKMASLGELTAGIAHEIQNPLNFVNNFSELNKELIAEMREEISKRNYDEANEIAKDVEENSEKINHHGKRAGDIVKGMLQHSRTSTGVKEPIDINALADEYLRLSYHGLRAKDKSFNATMKTDFDESIGKINIIPQDIGRVLLNLYNNAFYAVDERLRQDQPDIHYEPTVSVTTQKSDNHIIITVSDNGNGIPQNIVDKIFQPFFTTKPTGQGTGLGLSLSYDIIKAHGGGIRVESKEGEGTEFIIHLLFS